MVSPVTLDIDQASSKVSVHQVSIRDFDLVSKWFEAALFVLKRTADDSTA